MNDNDPVPGGSMTREETDQFAAECLALLGAIEAGDVVATPERDPWVHYDSNLAYTTPDGWKIVVYIDCGEWDWIDSISAPDGRAFEGYPRRPPYDREMNRYPGLAGYEPPDDRKWGFP